MTEDPLGPPDAPVADPPADPSAVPPAVPPRSAAPAAATPRPAAPDPRLDEAEALLSALPAVTTGQPDPEQVAQLEQVHSLLAATLASVPRG